MLNANEVNNKIIQYCCLVNQETANAAYVKDEGQAYRLLSGHVKGIANNPFQINKYLPAATENLVRDGRYLEWRGVMNALVFMVTGYALIITTLE